LKESDPEVRKKMNEEKHLMHDTKLPRGHGTVADLP